MSRLNLNSIISWVDSHIIGYPTTVMKNKKVFFFVCFVSLALLLFSPVYGVFWLLLSTLYFFYTKEYKSICISWFFFLFSWYLIFTACMFGFDGPIVVGTDFLGCGDKSPETRRIYWYVMDKYFPLFAPLGLWDGLVAQLCADTLLILAILSSKLGFPIYVPSLFKGLLALVKFIFGGKGSGSYQGKGSTGSGSYQGKGSTGSGSYQGKDSNASGFGCGSSMFYSPDEDSKPGGFFSRLFKTSKKPQEEVDYGSPTNPNRDNFFRSSNPDVNKKTFETCGKLFEQMQQAAQKQGDGFSNQKTVVSEGNVVRVTETGNRIANWFVDQRFVCDIRKATADEIEAERAVRAYSKNVKK